MSENERMVVEGVPNVSTQPPSTEVRDLREGFLPAVTIETFWKVSVVTVRDEHTTAPPRNYRKFDRKPAKLGAAKYEKVFF